MIIFKDLLIKDLERFIDEYDLKKSVPNTHEWYLLNNTRNFIEELKIANTSSDIKNATNKYGMFCTESMDWDTKIYKKCTTLIEIGYKLARDIK